MLATRTIRIALSVTITALVCLWTAPLLADENDPDGEPGWWNDPNEASVTTQAGWNFNDDEDPDHDQRPDWQDDDPSVVGNGAERVDGAFGVPRNCNGDSATITFYIWNFYVEANVKEVWIQFDVLLDNAQIKREKVNASWPPEETDGKVSTDTDEWDSDTLEDGWQRLTRVWVISPQPVVETFELELKTVNGLSGTALIDNVWIGTHCELQNQSNHAEGYYFHVPFAPPDQPVTIFDYSQPWYEGTQWTYGGSHPIEWMPELTDHETVIGLPASPMPQFTEMFITMDDEFDPERTRPISYQYDRYVGGGEVFTEEVVPPGTMVENRVEEVEELDEGWQRVRVSLDATPRPELETIHFMMFSTDGRSGPVAIDNLILSAGHARMPLFRIEPARVELVPGMTPGLPAEPENVGWSDDFDSYELGTGLHGQGGWKGWDNDPTLDAYVTDTQAHSAPHSADVAASTDVVREFSGCTSGAWSFSTWQYIPSDFSSEGSGQFAGSYLILLNTYEDGGPHEESDWSAQLNFDSNDGMLKVYYGDGLNTVDVPYIPEQWVEIVIVIDLDIDLCTIYYHGEYITEYSWTGGVTGVGGGALSIAAVDLYANGATSVYYDDFSLVRLEP
jgi:hypothetical protein